VHQGLNFLHVRVLDILGLMSYLRYN